MSEWDEDDDDGGGEGEAGGAVLTKSKEKTEKPPLYKVLIHNDNFTTMEFVVFIMVTVFRKSPIDAWKIMMAVHQQGVGVAGVYTFEIAESKAEKAIKLAREREFPLLCTVEKE